jgi:hypothetical protein
MNNLSKAGPSSTSIYAVRVALTYPSAIKLRTIPLHLAKREQSWWQIELLCSRISKFSACSIHRIFGFRVVISSMVANVHSGVTFL